MSISSLILIISISILGSAFARNKWRGWFLLLASIAVIYWLQPPTPIRHLDFWLPSACIFLTLFTWVITNPDITTGLQKNLPVFIVIFLAILAIGVTRYFEPLCCLTSTSPPSIEQIFIAVIITIAVIVLAVRRKTHQSNWIYTTIILIIGLFITIKFDPFTKLASIGLRALNSQSIQLASPFDIRWLGFSYVAFRLMHTLRDRLSGKLPDLTLMEYVIYIIFFPAFSAGPIDRVQRFTQDLRGRFQPTIESTLQAGKRIFLGIFNKYVIADGLALLALNSTNSSQAQTSGWMWIMLYAYAFRIYFDFAGYTDIAIGIGQLFGIQLPENFEKPYQKQNLTLFWNSWHMTLAQWFRSYLFNPLTRSLRSSSRNIPLPLIIFIGQLTTFTLIGLWHGITLNFAIWGAWHGIGLFIHNRWSNFIRSKAFYAELSPHLKPILGFFGIFFTFNYISIGWVWFALLTPAESWNYLLKLFRLV